MVDGEGAMGNEWSMMNGSNICFIYVSCVHFQLTVGSALVIKRLNIFGCW